MGKSQPSRGEFFRYAPQGRGIRPTRNALACEAGGDVMHNYKKSAIIRIADKKEKEVIIKGH